eukprot:1140166-Pelagomonas_calceolata.AAC.3
MAVAKIKDVMHYLGWVQSQTGAGTERAERARQGLHRRSRQNGHEACVSKLGSPGKANLLQGFNIVRSIVENRSVFGRKQLELTFVVK